MRFGIEFAQKLPFHEQKFCDLIIMTGKFFLKLSYIKENA